jgi:hypothetical protein
VRIVPRFGVVGWRAGGVGGHAGTVIVPGVGAGQLAKKHEILSTKHETNLKHERRKLETERPEFGDFFVS